MILPGHDSKDNIFQGHCELRREKSDLVINFTWNTAFWLSLSVSSKAIRQETTRIDLGPQLVNHCVHLVFKFYC